MPSLSSVALNRVPTWIGLLLAILGGIVSVALVDLHWLVTQTIALIAITLGMQLLVRRQETRLQWITLLRWRAVGAFLCQYFYFLLLTLPLVGPVVAFALFNVFLVPAIYQVFGAEGVPIPLIIRHEVAASNLLVQYWWMTLPLPIFSLMGLMQGRLAWQLARADTRSPLGVVSPNSNAT